MSRSESKKQISRQNDLATSGTAMRNQMCTKEHTGKRDKLSSATAKIQGTWTRKLYYARQLFHCSLHNVFRRATSFPLFKLSAFFSCDVKMHSHIKRYYVTSVTQK